MWSSPSVLRRRGVLGINRRNLELINLLNDRSCFPVADDKVLTKQMAGKFDITTPELYANFSFTSELKQLPLLLSKHEHFVIKPAHGAGGEGVLIIDGRKDQNYLDVQGTVITRQALRDHCAAILYGLYSLGGQDDSVMIEEKVNFDPSFMNVIFENIPDIRVIVLHGVPIMAMLRIPTKESKGKANLHQGAIGVGIDIVTGITTNGVHKNKLIEKHPDSGLSVAGLNIPEWSSILEIAAKCYDFSELGYLGVDIVFDREKGPVLLEINARPGLAVQIANQCGLLERIRSLKERQKQAKDELKSLSIKARLLLVEELFSSSES